jgi:hypothetical protein
MAGKLTPKTKTEIRKYANKASRELTGKNMPRDQPEQVYSGVEALRGRDKPSIVGKEAVALWQAKIDYAIVNGDLKTLKTLMTLPKPNNPADEELQWYDTNGGCSCGGTGTSGW